MRDRRKAIDLAKIGLKPRECYVLQYAVKARSLVSNGHYLCSQGQNRAAERLIARKFLTRVAGVQFFPPQPGWLVVKITPRNLAALRAAERNAGHA
jgi:hypothetical protein